MEFRIVTFTKKIIKKQVLETFIAFEKTFFKAVKAVTMAHTMEHQVYFFFLMRIKKLTEVCAMIKRNYDPTTPTSYDDRTTFT